MTDIAPKARRFIPQERGAIICKYSDALEEQQYTVFLSIGVNEIGRVKIAASPVMRQLRPDLYKVVRDEVLATLDRLVTTPLDDLERS